MCWRHLDWGVSSLCGCRWWDTQLWSISRLSLLPMTVSHNWLRWLCSLRLREIEKFCLWCIPVWLEIGVKPTKVHWNSLWNNNSLLIDPWEVIINQILVIEVSIVKLSSDECRWMKSQHWSRYCHYLSQCWPRSVSCHVWSLGQSVWTHPAEFIFRKLGKYICIFYN